TTVNVRFVAHGAKGVEQITAKRIQETDRIHLIDLLSNSERVTQFFFEAARASAADIPLPMFSSVSICRHDSSSFARSRSHCALRRKRRQPMVIYPAIGFRIRPMARTTC